jgi:hypothetical protein
MRGRDEEDHQVFDGKGIGEAFHAVASSASWANMDYQTAWRASPRLFTTGLAMPWRRQQPFPRHPACRVDPPATTPYVLALDEASNGPNGECSKFTT